MKNNYLSISISVVLLLLGLLSVYGGVTRTSSNLFFPLESSNRKLDSLENRLVDLINTRFPNIRPNLAADLIIPREGFPYCEPFTGSTPRENTIYGGEAKLTSENGDPKNKGVLQLTNNNRNETGYIYVDLPFSSTYGIKTSFEYFAYNPADGGKPGDGFSFFLFDGDLGPDSGPNQFDIGGLGGSLGYSPLRYSQGDFLGGYGLKGAYMGIGLDERGNWGNQYEGRYGGFENPTTYGSGKHPDNFPRYPNNISIRGPVDSFDFSRNNGAVKVSNVIDVRPNGDNASVALMANPPAYYSYPFIDGKIVNNFKSDGAPYDVLASKYFLPIGKQFTIGALTRAEDCNKEGYRKVFIDLKPDGSGSFTITMYLMVNHNGNKDLIQIFNEVPYPYPAPKNLKVGFAASTGEDFRSVHEIRNVTVDVSEKVKYPLNTSSIKEDFCEGESERELLLTVPLKNDNSFIRCIQLYYNPINAPAPPTFSPNWPDEANACELEGICSYSYCLNGNESLEVPGKGNFEITGIDEVNEEGNIIGKINVKFTADPLFNSGKAEVWYTVTDNYGQISDPQPIEILYTPLPKIDPTAAITGPTCYEQSDGSISEVLIENLLPIPNSSFKWYRGEGLDGNGNIKNKEELSGGTINGITGLKRGRYYLEVINTNGGEGCPVIQEFIVDEVTGTVVKVDVFDKEICQDNPVFFTPELASNTLVGKTPKFLWYKNQDGTQLITDGIIEDNGSGEEEIKYFIDENGVLKITGLKARLIPYEYFVEVETDINQDLCANTDKQELKRVQVLVLPPLDIQLSITDDLCHQKTGNITVTASGGFPTKSYSLDGINFVSTNTFSGLLPGDYTVYVNAGAQCVGQEDFTILGPDKPLTISETGYTDPTCGNSNGEITVTIEGGIPKYTIQAILNGTAVQTLEDVDGPITFSGLKPGAYTISVKDQNTCPISAPVTLTNDPGYSFTIDDTMSDEICLGETAVIKPKFTTTGTPIFKWYKDAAGTEEVVTSPTADSDGIITLIDSDYTLSVEGLAVGSYSYFIGITAGAGYCKSLLYEAKIEVFPKLEGNSTSIAEQCFGASDGTITVNATGGNGVYTYAINGETPQPENTFKNLAPGDYDIEIFSNECSFTLSETVTGPDLLTISTIPSDPTCGNSDGEITVTIEGGIPKYTVQAILNGTAVQTLEDVDGPITFTGLKPGAYTISVNDQNTCPISATVTLTNDPRSAFAIEPLTDETCFGQVAEIIPDFTTNGTPTLKWYKDAAGQDEVVSSSTADSDGIITLIGSDNSLSVEGLAEGAHTYYLGVTGAEYCPISLFEAKITVFPELSGALEMTPEQCFGASDGTITVNATGGNGDYTYSLDGGTKQTSNVFSGLAPGEYEIKIFTSNDCYYPLSETVTGPSSAITTNTPDIIRESCNSSNGVIENLIISGGWGDYSVEWRKGSLTGPTVTGDIDGAENLAPDTYFLVVTDAEGCTEDFSFIVEAQPDPVYEMTAPIKSCADIPIVFTPINTKSGSATSEVKWYKNPNKTGEIQAGVDSDDSSITYTIDDTDWSNPKLTIDGLAPGEYTYYFFVECTEQQLEAKVEIFPTPNVTFTPTPVQCFGAADGKIKVASGGSATQVYLIDGGSPITQEELEAMTFAPKVYNIQVQQDGVGCPASKNVEVLGPPAEISINQATVNNSSCSLDNGSIQDLEISGGWGNYTVEWRKGSKTGPKVTGDETGAKDLAPDTYYLLIKDAEGCTYEEIYEVKADPLPDYEVDPRIEICANLPVLISPVNQIPGSTAQEVKWYKGPNQTGEITAGKDSSDPAVNYTIDDTDWNKPTLTITGLKPGTYTFYVYSTCSRQDLEVEVEVFPIPEVLFEATPVQCFGADDGKIKIASGGSSNQVYFVDGGSGMTAAELEAMSFAPKIYDIRVEQAGVGCPANFPVEVLAPDSPLAAAPLIKTDPACGQDVGSIETTLTGGWSPYKVELFKDGTSIKTETVDGPTYKAEDLAPGEYYLKITDTEGCSITTAPITLVYGPTQVKVDPVEICEGDAAVLVPTTNPPATGATFEWFKDAGFTDPIVSGSTNAQGHNFQIAANGKLTITGLTYAASPYKYYVRAVGGDVCLGFEKEAIVEVFDKPVLSIADNSPVVCYGDDGKVVLSATGGSGTYEYSINGSPFQSSPEFELPAGTYTATVRSGGCEDTLPVEVKGPAAPITHATPVVSNPTCSQPNGVVKFQISGGYGDYKVESFKDGVSMGAPVSSTGDFQLNNLLAGDYTFSITDGKGCLYELSTPVTLVDGLTPLEADDQEICEGEVANITPSSSQIGISPTFTWYRNSDKTDEIVPGIEDGITYQVASNGQLSITGLPPQSAPYVYYVGISGPGVCEPPLEKVEVKVYSIPNLRVSNPSIVCDPTQTVDLTEFIEGFNSSVYDYQIFDPSGSQMRLEDIDEVKLSGSYVVQSGMKGSTCWSPVQRIQVKIAKTELIAKFNYEADLGGGNILVNDIVQILETVDFKDTSTGEVMIWEWDFGDGNSSSDQNPEHVFTEKGTFTVTLTTIDEIGCVSVYQRVIEVRDDYVIMIPNAFTPDGTKNQNFKPQFRGIASMEFYVFNTWGELIFETNSLETDGWDGTLNGTLVPNGNYVYKAVFGTRSGGKVEKAGVFILIR